MPLNPELTENSDIVKISSRVRNDEHYFSLSIPKRFADKLGLKPGVRASVMLDVESAEIIVKFPRST